jgi:hypothetical protein
MQTNNISKELQQIQNNVGIIISYFFIRQNQTLVPKIDPDYVNNQITNLSDKMNKINFNYNNGVSDNSSSFSSKNIEFLNKSISQIHLHDLSETTTSKYIDDKKLKEIEAMIQKQKMQIRELGALLQKNANTPPIQTIQTNPQPIIKNFIIPDNEVSKLNAQIKAIDSKMSLFKNDINKYVLDKKNAVNKSLKLFSDEYKKLLQMINSVNNTLTKQINILTTRVNTLNNQSNTKMDNMNLSFIKTIQQTNRNLDFKISSVNSRLSLNINQKEAELVKSINTVNTSLTQTINQKEAALNTRINTLITQIDNSNDVALNNRIDTVNTSLTQTINQKEAVLVQSINTVNTSLTQTINQKEAALVQNINTVNTSLTQTINQNINTLNSALTQTINQKEAALNTRIDLSLTQINSDKEATLNNRIDTVNSNLTQTINQKESNLNNRIDTVNSNLNNRIDTVNSNLSLTINQKESNLNNRIDTVNSNLTQTINQQESNLNNRIDTVNSNLTQTINQQESSLNCYIDRINTDLEKLSNNITTNFDVLYEDTNQNSGRTVYLDNLKVNKIEFSSVSNISDIISLSTALGNLTTNFNLIYQNTNVYSDKTAYFNKLVAQNIECNNFTGVSDERLKKNIIDLKNVGGDLQKLRTVGFDWKSNNEADIGFIAQDVEKIFPSMVKTDKDGFKSVKYMNFVPILVQGYREQANEISKLKKILIIGLVVFFFLFMYKCI